MEFKDQLQEKIDTRTKPVGSLGKLEDIAFKVGMVQHSLSPELKNPAMIVFAADHGIEEEGVSPCPKKITWQQCMNMVTGGCGISVFSKQHNFNLTVVDVGVDFDFPKEYDIKNEKIAYGSKNMLHSPAMTREQCEKAMSIGAKYVKKEAERGCNVIGFGEMGIANTSPASLILYKLANVPLEDCVGRGAGLDAPGVNHKLNVLKEIAQKYNPKTPMEILTTFGGFEIAAITGAVLEAKRQNMLIIADGFITSSGFLVASHINPSVLDNVLFSHTSDEKGHKAMIEAMKGEPILNLRLRLGEGSGVPICYPIIQSALVFLNNMPSFDDAKVYDVHNERQP